MIVLSLLLVLGSAVMLIMGLAGGEQVLIWASIGASVVAALALTAAVLRRRGDAGAPLTPAMQAHGGLAVGGSLADTGRHHVGADGSELSGTEVEQHPDPPDEPPVEEASASDVLRIVDLRDEVLVVDGRPRYHVAGCRHLIGRATIGLPLSEAREAEFTPCAWCRPDGTLADRARRGSSG